MIYHTVVSSYYFLSSRYTADIPRFSLLYHKPIQKVNERSDAHGHFQRTVPVMGQAEGQLRQPVLQLFLRADSCRKASQRPHGDADHCGVRLRESAVGGDCTTAAARLSIHRKRKRASAEAPAIFFAARSAESRNDILRFPGNAHGAPADLRERLCTDHPQRSR